MRAFVLTDFGTTPELVTSRCRSPARARSGSGCRRPRSTGSTCPSPPATCGMMEHRFPVVLGKDFAGTVDAIGPGVTGFVPGDPVFGVVTKPYLGEGGFGEYVTVLEVGITALPEGVDPATAGALGLAGTAAADSLAATAPQAGETVVVSGATGGVGAIAVQYAAAAGAQVIATARPGEEADFVRGHPRHPRRGLHRRRRRPDPRGQPRRRGRGPALRRRRRRPGRPAEGGRFVSTMIGSPDQVPAEGVTVVAVYATPDAQTLGRSATHQDEGTTRVVVQRTYGLEQAPAALADFTGGTLGKLVVTI